MFARYRARTPVVRGSLSHAVLVVTTGSPNAVRMSSLGRLRELVAALAHTYEAAIRQTVLEPPMQLDAAVCPNEIKKDHAI
jgi:hypothetical protein